MTTISSGFKKVIDIVSYSITIYILLIAIIYVTTGEVSKAVQLFGGSQPPVGKWLIVYWGPNISVQADLSSIRTRGSSTKIWMREDRLEEFESSMGLTGNVVLSEVTINCEKKSVITHKQIAFDDNLEITGETTVDSSFNVKKSSVEIIALAAFCSKDENGDNEETYDEKKPIPIGRMI